MHRLYKNNTKTLSEVQVAIYDPEFSLIYHDDSKVDYVKEDAEMLSGILKKKEISFCWMTFRPSEWCILTTEKNIS